MVWWDIFTIPRSSLSIKVMRLTVMDPGFPLGGHGPVGCGSLTLVLFSENVCENKRIGSCREGGRAPEVFVCRSANGQG